MASLADLPVEVIEAITDKLNPRDLISLRLSCKEISQKTFHRFGQAYFTTLRTDLTHDNLQRLLSISKHGQLSHFVRKLVIKARDNHLGRGFHWHRLEDGNHSACVDAWLSLGVQLLRDILKGMTKCNSFHIYSYGGLEVYYDWEFLLPSDAVSIILSVIADTGLPIKSFFVDFRNWGAGSVDAKRVQMSLCQRPTFRNAWKSVEELRLELLLTPETFDWAKDLVLQTTSLKKLSLHFDFDHTTSFIGNLVAFPQVFQGLQEFKLGCAHVTVNMLSSILIDSRSNLLVLSFWHVYLQQGTWAALLEQIRRSLPLLESINIEWLKEYSNDEIVHIQFPTLEDNRVIPGTNGRKLELRYKKWKRPKSIWGASYRGRIGMDKALGMLAESAVHT
ncbi:hypothetical protein JMJ35_008941 [Cladonia borealis]|uniref:F-box domain-containing protein n=1 Tax=Cladonia borealis TaxID=184061 RepID=A0AA39V6R8_9LECA|nr:hypothetical protein JMJ35_008941 [Cladonia borealis]